MYTNIIYIIENSFLIDYTDNIYNKHNQLGFRH